MLPLLMKNSKGSTHMGRIVVTEYMSVDGVVEAPSGDESFERVGWTDAFSRGEEADRGGQERQEQPEGSKLAEWF